jgi:hypothetical protein
MDIVKDWGREAQQAAEDHLNACDDLRDLEEAGEFADWEAIDIAGPYCGCQTCTVRETLHAAWPILKLAFEAGMS